MYSLIPFLILAVFIGLFCYMLGNSSSGPDRNGTSGGDPIEGPGGDDDQNPDGDLPKTGGSGDDVEIEYIEPVSAVSENLIKEIEVEQKD